MEATNEQVVIGRDLVRLGTPSKGDTIHRATCRYARKHPNALHWTWAEGRPVTDWTVNAPWLRACQVCRPDLPAPSREAGE